LKDEVKMSDTGSSMPDGWAPDGIMAGVPDINAAAGQSSLPMVMDDHQIAQMQGVGSDPGTATSGDVAAWGTPITAQAYGGQTGPVSTAPDPAGYARDGEFARQLQADPNDPNGNTGLGGLAYTAGQELQFHGGGPLDAQAHGGSRADGNYDFGVYNAAAGIPLSGTLDLANTYGKYFSTYDPTQITMDQTYTHIPADNVQNITKGYHDYQNGKFGGTN
jgi:hypothetical protein